MPAPFLMARSMTSRETLSRRAFSMAAKSRALPSGSGPPILAATAISLTSFEVLADFRFEATSRLARSHWRPIGPVTDTQPGGSWQASPGRLRHHPEADVIRRRPWPKDEAGARVDRREVFPRSA